MAYLMVHPMAYQWQEPINRSLHIHCILESTFARIFLFLELPFLQEAQFYLENISQSSSLEDSSDLPAITVTFRRDHFMWGKHAALFWLGILNSARESSHPQCSKNKKIRAKVDSEGLYGRGRLLFMGSWLLRVIQLCCPKGDRPFVAWWIIITVNEILKETEETPCVWKLLNNKLFQMRRHCY